jgi:hypothetical protein
MHFLVSALAMALLAGFLRPTFLAAMNLMSRHDIFSFSVLGCLLQTETATRAVSLIVAACIPKRMARVMSFTEIEQFRFDVKCFRKKYFQANAMILI